MKVIEQGWADHGSDPTGVFQRLPEALTLVRSPIDVGAVAQLAAHVAGEHLGRWDDGVAFLKQCLVSPELTPDAPSVKEISRFIATLYHCGGKSQESTEWLDKALTGGIYPEASDKIRLLAQAAAMLSGQKRAGEAAAALREALSLAAYGPAKADPASRALAASGNNIAMGLEELPSRTTDEINLMILAAQTARLYWEVAGTWLETERAEYRLVMTFLAAGDPARALTHARLCHDICEDNNAVPYEKFYAREALAKALHASSQTALARIERAEAQALIPLMKAEAQPDCVATLGVLDRLLGLA